MISKPYSFGRRLLLAFGVLAVAFACATLAVSWFSYGIEARTEALAANALPSIEHLAGACDALRDLETITGDYPDLSVEKQAEAREMIGRKWADVDAHLAVYLGLPAFPGERELYESGVPAALRGVTVSLTHLFVKVDAHDAAAARLTADREVRAAANHATRLLRRMLTFNASHANAEVRRISRIHQTAGRGGLILAGMTVFASLAVAAWVRREFITYDELVQAHSAMLEQRADELEMFGKRVAHDLLSPLSALTYCLGAFKRASEAEPKLLEAVTRARSCVLRAQRMVDGLFEFARAGGGPEPGARAELRDVIEDVSAEVRNADAAPPEVSVEGVETCLVACSRGVLGSILGNLMRNAAKYMSDSAVKQIFVRVRERPESVSVEVEDTGPGIPEGLEGRIFEPYVRAEGVTQAGLGLGLATVKRLCEAHGGEVGVRSPMGKGAVFWFTLPKASAVVESKQPASGSMVRRIS